MQNLSDKKELTRAEWLDFHAMILESKAMLLKDRDGQYTPDSLKAARSSVSNALDWLRAKQNTSPFVNLEPRA